MNAPHALRPLRPWEWPSRPTFISNGKQEKVGALAKNVPNHIEALTQPLMRAVSNLLIAGNVRLIAQTLMILADAYRNFSCDFL